MKLEREPLFGHIALSHKPDPKSFDYDELSLDSNGIKSGKVVKETQNGHSHDYKDNNKDNNRDDGQLLYLMNDGNSIAASKIDCFEKTENLNSCEDCQAKDFAAPFAKSSSEVESLKNESDFYTDKSAMVCEMPELQVCYRDSTYSSVKDICVDEGLHSKDKLLFEDSSDKKSLCSFVFPDQDLGEELKGERDICIIGPNDFINSLENSSNADLVCKSEDLTPTGQVNRDTEDNLGNDIPQETEITILTEETEADNPNFRTPVLEESEVPQISSHNASITTQTNGTGPKLDAENSDSNSEEASIITAPDSSAEEPKISGAANDLPYSSKVEKRRITFNFDSSSALVNTAKEGTQSGVSERLETDSKTTTTTDTRIAPEEIREESEIEECSQTGVSGSSESPKTSSVDDEVFETQNASTQLLHAMDREENSQSSDSGLHKTPESSVVHDGLSGSQFASSHFQFGESSFSAAGPLSGRITYSGPIPYSGSISIRSDSSTTSTRSFAFPVLQNEWNSSPVRMAKADRRNFRKHRGWRQGILCCRF